MKYTTTIKLDYKHQITVFEEDIAKINKYILDNYAICNACQSEFDNAKHTRATQTTCMACTLERLNKQSEYNLIGNKIKNEGVFYFKPEGVTTKPLLVSSPEHSEPQEDMMRTFEYYGYPVPTTITGKYETDKTSMTTWDVLRGDIYKVDSVLEVRSLMYEFRNGNLEHVSRFWLVTNKPVKNGVQFGEINKRKGLYQKYMKAAKQQALESWKSKNAEYSFDPSSWQLECEAEALMFEMIKPEDIADLI